VLPTLSTGSASLSGHAASRLASLLVSLLLAAWCSSPPLQGSVQQWQRNAKSLEHSSV
jgi:hypothetical protein